jgi:hypothetical protein
LPFTPAAGQVPRAAQVLSDPGHAQIFVGREHDLRPNGNRLGTVRTSDDCFQNATLIFRKNQLTCVGVVRDHGCLLVILDTEDIGTTRDGTSAAMI